MFDLDGLADRARDKADAAYRDRQKNRDRFDLIERVLDDGYDSIRDRVADILEPVYELFEVVVGAFRWVLETVRVVYPVEFYRFVVYGDERTCPSAAPGTARPGKRATTRSPRRSTSTAGARWSTPGPSGASATSMSGDCAGSRGRNGNGASPAGSDRAGQPDLIDPSSLQLCRSLSRDLPHPRFISS